jgi:hypothetical protein
MTVGIIEYNLKSRHPLNNTSTPLWYCMLISMDSQPNILNNCLEGVSKVESKISLADFFCNLQSIPSQMQMISPNVGNEIRMKNRQKISSES